MKLTYALLSCVLLAIAGCGTNEPTVVPSMEGPPPGAVIEPRPPLVLPLYASEYPAWSVFGVAARTGLINKDKGKLGPLEIKWNTDIVLDMITYESCITKYGTAGGAICITNTDIVGLVGGRPSTAILATSTSYGADACIAVGVNDVDALKKETTYGLEKSVSDYAWYRGLEVLGKNPADYKFQNRDPEQAAQALQVGVSKVGQVWNPFTLQTLRKKKDAHILFDSTSIPGEIIDMVVMDNQTLAKPGGDLAAKCVCDVYYSVCDKLKSPGKTSDDTYVALGDQFSSLGAEDMKLCADMSSVADPNKKITTRFYDTPELGMKVFQSEHLTPIMAHIVRWAKVRQLITEAPSTTYAGESNPSALKFDQQYMHGSRSH